MFVSVALATLSTRPSVREEHGSWKRVEGGRPLGGALDQSSVGADFTEASPRHHRAVPGQRGARR